MLLWANALRVLDQTLSQFLNGAVAAKISSIASNQESARQTLTEGIQSLLSSAAHAQHLPVRGIGLQRGAGRPNAGFRRVVRTFVQSVMLEPRLVSVFAVPSTPQLAMNQH